MCVPCCETDQRQHRTNDPVDQSVCSGRDELGQPGLDLIASCRTFDERKELRPIAISLSGTSPSHLGALLPLVPQPAFYSTEEETIKTLSSTGWANGCKIIIVNI
ncbi:unnamed protein product [Gadus morhua 'NCC']